MQANRALGDGQSQSDAAGLAAAGIVDAIKRLKEFVERFFRHARTGVGNLDDSFRADCSLPALQSDLHVRAFACVVDSIAHHVFDGTSQQCRIAHHHAVIHLGYVDLALAALRLEFGVLGDFADELFQADRDFLHGSIAALKPRNGEQSPDQLVQTSGFELDTLQRALSFGSTALAA